MRVELKRIGEKIDFTNLVGKESVVLDKTTMIYSWDNDRKELGIIINNMEGDRVGTETISLAFGLVTFIEKLESYGFNVVITDGISYSVDTKNKVQGLIQAGFVKLIKLENNYMVDNIFQQTFLLENELQYLLENNVLEINLFEIK
ncbi:hypothetical protein VSU16_04770 [Cetobacterium somerae]|uniref:hypothetical protein n=1 Tax=Cetobacterium somerae TaxID=188913 RepID=UPI002E7B69B4|nr:hypothetical protein [Cetobacterium somerae]WVJ02057.1 hypothetical protein VSU16_04770 [Cetobacterium somerae]